VNCKPNDLAIVVRDTFGSSCMRNLIGTPVTVETAFKTANSGLDAWTLRSGPIRCPSCGGVFIGLLDADLQPINGQRADADDSTRVEEPEEVTA
jgi:hypothetical protein